MSRARRRTRTASRTDTRAKRRLKYEVGLKAPPRLHFAVAEPKPSEVGHSTRDRVVVLARRVRGNKLQECGHARTELTERSESKALALGLLV